MMLSIQEINRKRTELQSKGFNDWIKANGVGIFEWATGVGKTHLATHHAIPTMNKTRPEYKTIVLVPSKVLQDDWLGNKTKKGYIKELGLKNVEVWVINSFIKLRHRCDLLVIDEIHRISNRKALSFSSALKCCETRYLLGLSATLNSVQRKFLAESNVHTISKITLRQAELEGLVSEHTIYNIGIELQGEDLALKEEVQEKFNKYSSKFNGSLDLAIECGKSINPRWNPDMKEWFEPMNVAYAREMGWNGINLEEAVQNYRRKLKLPRGQRGSASVWKDEPDDFEFTPTKIQVYGSQYIRYMNKRKDYLLNAYQKLEITRQIVDKFKVPTIVFSQRTKFADRITNTIGNDICVSYHSNLESQPINDEFGNPIRYKSGRRKNQIKLFGVSTLQKHNLNEFAKGNYRVISAAKGLDEGVDIPSLTMAIITGGDGVERQNTQRSGRPIRPEEGKFAIIVHVYVKDSQEEVWLTKRQVSGKAPIWISSVDEIKIDKDEQIIEIEDDSSDTFDEEGDSLSF